MSSKKMKIDKCLKPLQQASAGTIVWGKLGSYQWWPGIIIRSTDCGQPEAKFGNLWLFWFGDHKISEISRKKIVGFTLNFLQMYDGISGKNLRKAVFEALEILACRCSYHFEKVEALISWAKTGFQDSDEALFSSTDMPTSVLKHLECLQNSSTKASDSDDVGSDSAIQIFNSNVPLKMVREGSLKIQDVCIACYENEVQIVDFHPLCNGGLCLECKERLQENMFAYGNDGKNMCCSICAKPGSLIICDSKNCHRSFCNYCIILLLGPDEKKKISTLCPIDLIIGGSPCNDLSLVNPVRKGIYDVSGTGQLFFDFFYILNTVRRFNNQKHVFFLYENVAAMSKKSKSIISTFLAKEPALIDAKFVSPQIRPRYFWGNIPGLQMLNKYCSSSHNDMISGLGYQQEKLLDHCLLKNLGRKAVIEKIRTVTTQRNSLIQNNYTLLPVEMNGEYDVLWITELERIFGFPIHYTDTGNLNIQKRQELLGRSWSVPVIKDILQPLKNFFKTKDDLL
ncbi:unnamed protein product [Larinioides sclopetarius]|uniref:DNA (cytosine-5-)-methyltransferase n=1 Tax=Larinioides sclopetarius TaxID=280406 RepID=A0AAV2BFE8_9ARAC